MLLFDETLEEAYRRMEALTSLSAHATAAAFFAYNNWERFSFFMQEFGGLENFNAYYVGALSEAQLARLRLFVAGFTACMHHHPSLSWNIAQPYIEDHAELNELPLALFDYIEAQDVLENRAMLRQLRKYYHSAAEAYRMVQRYEELMGD